MKTSQVNYITISVEETDQRIDNFLFKKLKLVPKSALYRLLRKGEIRVNNIKRKPKYKLQFGDILKIPYLWQWDIQKIPISSSSSIKKYFNLNNAILYEDDYLIILNKPTGLAVHGGSGLNFGVIEILRASRPESCFLELVHRLDRETSGALLIAKKHSTLRSLHKKLYMQDVKKIYLALVRGQWPVNIHVITMPLIKRRLSTGKYTVQVSNDGKYAKTFFTIKEQFTLATLMEVRPITGRTHQIRVHAKYMGCPIAYDKRYGDSLFDQQLPSSSNFDRLFLHANTLCFEHPNNGKTLCITAPIDEYLNKCLYSLRTK